MNEIQPSDVKTRLMQIIARHDSVPRKTWMRVDRTTFVAETPEKSYSDWLNNFAEDILVTMQHNGQKVLPNQGNQGSMEN